MPYGTGAETPSPPSAMRLRSTQRFTQRKTGMRRSETSCPNDRAGSRIQRCSPVAGSWIPMWFETATVYQILPRPSKRRVCG